MHVEIIEKYRVADKAYTLHCYAYYRHEWVQIYIHVYVCCYKLVYF